MTSNEETFLNAYYKACNSSQPEDWMQVALAAKWMYNATRKPEDLNLEHQIQKKHTPPL